MREMSCDVLVVGAGPGGSTAAALLAERGHDVLLVEKDRHPRFHIGESLLPLNTAIFDRLGVRERVAELGVHKPGAEFVDDETGREVQFSFAHGLDKRFTSSWQIKREDLDLLLFRTAQARGARTLEGTRVTSVQQGERALASAMDEAGELRISARFVVDASGRDTLMAGRLGLKHANKRNDTAAVYAHYTGAERRSGEREGFISVHLAEDGWFWMIPLRDGLMSVGFVGNADVFKGRRGTPADLLDQRIAASPTVSRRMRRAERVSDVTATGNYSYTCSTNVGEGCLMIGDAFAFLDPVFSSGVLLAMTSGELAVDVVEAWLESPARGRARAARMERTMRHAMGRLGWLVYRINTPALRMLFMAPRNAFRMRDGLVSLLAGNLRGRWDTVLPVLAFKAVYYITAGLLRAGMRRRLQQAVPVAVAAE